MDRARHVLHAVLGVAEQRALAWDLPHVGLKETSQLWEFRNVLSCFEPAKATEVSHSSQTTQKLEW